MALAAVPVRAVESAFGIFRDKFLQQPTMDTPSYSAARLWTLRVGLYKLTRPKTQASDWMWIVDHSVQIGSTKVNPLPPACRDIVPVCFKLLPWKILYPLNPRRSF